MGHKTACLLLLLLCSCAPPLGSLRGPLLHRVEDQLAAGRWSEALRTCGRVLRDHPDDCAARYCELIGQALIFVDQVNGFMLPRFQRGGRATLGDLINVQRVRRQLDRATRAADEATARGCELDLPRVPLRIGDAAEPLLAGEIRGRWTQRTAHNLGAILYAFRYLFNNLISRERVPKEGERMPPPLPESLARLDAHLTAHDRLLLAEPPGPLRVDLFVPGSERRVLDFSDAAFVPATALPRGALWSRAAQPAGRCGYRRWHIDTLIEGKHVGNTDGLSFSPDGHRLALPIQHQGRYQIHITDERGKNPRCLTCSSPGSNDGVRWQPGGEALLFISDRDHPHAIGNAGGGAGQELYVMRSDGSRQTRLTVSPGFATNYHANWSKDGKRIVWGSTAQRTWDILVADFVDDPCAPRLANVRRLTHDTTWWESHGFSADGKAVITSNTRAGLMASDLYAIDIETRALTRLTDDPAWDEHAHLSPDARKLAWISGRWEPASILRMNQRAHAPVFDFFWIVPGILFQFINPPAGQATELTLMDADGSHVQRLTFDKHIVADNQWSPDGTRILFRQVPGQLFHGGRIRMLTFDDCAPEPPSQQSN